MNGSMVPLRYGVLVILVLGGVLFALGVFHWNAKPYGCFNGKSYYGDWVTTMEIWHLDIRQKAWGCRPGDRYDPKQFSNTIDLQHQPVSQ